MLEDDKGFFPLRCHFPVVQRGAGSQPRLDDALNTLFPARSITMRISTLNAQVDIEYRTPQQVAHQFLQGQSLAVRERLWIRWHYAYADNAVYLATALPFSILAGRAGRRSGDYHRRTVGV